MLQGAAQYQLQYIGDITAWHGYQIDTSMQLTALQVLCLLGCQHGLPATDICVCNIQLFRAKIAHKFTCLPTPAPNTALHVPQRGMGYHSEKEFCVHIAAGKEYCQADSRYATRDPFTICMEAITAFVEGPLCFVILYGMLKQRPWRFTLQFAVSLGQLYGDVLYFATSYYDGKHPDLWLINFVNTCASISWASLAPPTHSDIMCGQTSADDNFVSSILHSPSALLEPCIQPGLSS